MQHGDGITTRERELEALDRLRSVARVWDDLVRIPVIGRRIGLDALLGLVPGIGDAIAALVAAGGLLVAGRLGAPASVLLRMLLNIVIDTLIGAIPLFGDLFDVGWRAQHRNVALLERWVATPHRTVRSSQVLLASLAGGVVVAVGVSCWLAVQLLMWLWSSL